MATENILTRHHIYPKHLGWSNKPCNITRLRLNIHNALHLITDDRQGQAQAPREQFVNLLDINAQALTNDFKNDLLNLLAEQDPAYYYERWIIKPRYLKET